MDITQFIYPFILWWTFGLFPPFYLVKYLSSFKWFVWEPNSVLSGICLGWNCWIISQSMFNFLKNHHNRFPQQLNLFTLPPPGFPGGTCGKEPNCQCRRHNRHGFDPWVGKIPGRGHATHSNSCLENLHKGAWRTTIHRVARSQIWLKRQVRMHHNIQSFLILTNISFWKWNGSSLWFWFAFHQKLMMLSIFSCTNYPHKYLLWRKLPVQVKQKFA